MSKHLGVAKTLELLERLRGAVRDAATREEKINTELRTRVNRERQLRDRAVNELKDRLNQELAEMETAHQAGTAALMGKIAVRKHRISRAHEASRKQMVARANDHEGSRKYRLQKEELQSGRTRDADLAAAEKRYVEFQEALAQAQTEAASVVAAAANAFAGYREYKRLLTHPRPGAELNPTADEQQLLREADGLVTKARDGLKQFGAFFLPRLFRLMPLWLGLATVPFLMVPLGPKMGGPKLTWEQAGIYAGAYLVFGAILYFVGKGNSAVVARSIGEALERVHRLHAVGAEKAETRRVNDLARAESDFQQRNQSINEQWGDAIDAAGRMREDGRTHVEAKAARAWDTYERSAPVSRERLAGRQAEELARLRAVAEARQVEIERATQEREARFAAEHQEQWRELEADWQARVPQIYAAIQESTMAAAQSFPPWHSPAWTEWIVPSTFGNAAEFGELEIDLAKLAELTPRDPRLAGLVPAHFALPLMLSYPNEGSIVFETIESGKCDSIDALNNIVLRLLAAASPGRLNFTVVDPVGLGQSFAGIMHLADYGEHLIDSRIWTQTAQIEQKLAELNDHMEKVIQMYLRNEYETIAEYNLQAGNIAEKYYYLVIADFPVNFSEVAIKRLLSITASGGRCGVYTLIHWDQRHPLPHSTMLEELRKSSVCISRVPGKPSVNGKIFPGVTINLEPPPPPEIATDFIHQVGRANRDSNRVEVPFAHVIPGDADIWTADTVNELRVAIGRTGATKLQYLAIGKGTRQHALIAGKTGSGKSTLFHVIITNLALWCSPEQVEFYLIDFKKGVEFKCYGEKRLPHARVVAIESDREFGLSVLQRVDAELKRRGDLFRGLGVQDLAGYKRAGGTEPVPRSLLLIDEFQEYFVEDDKVAQGASVLLDRIVRQGRAFGIHVILGSQTLGGAYSMARTTLGQMVIRIALQCNEADAYLIMDDSNPAPRFLSRPGEGIYNDAAGNIEGNSPFQAVWISDDERDAQLDKVRARADASGKDYPGPIVFEGDAPADVTENPLLRAVLNASTMKAAASPRVWLGSPNSIKGPTEAIFHRQSGNNLLVVGQRDEAGLSILAVALVALAAQLPRANARFILLDSSPPESPQREFLQRVVASVPHDITLPKHNEIGEVMAGLGTELKRRNEDERGTEAPAIYILINGLQRYTKLRFEEDFGFSSDEGESGAKPGAVLNELICEGTSFGFHVIATCDTYNNVNRCLSKKAFSEFEMRVLFQMSANDSASLIDTPKASTLGLHRALFYNEQEGYLEVFRPYALPGHAWLEQTAKDLARLLAI